MSLDSLEYSKKQIQRQRPLLTRDDVTPKFVNINVV